MKLVFTLKLKVTLLIIALFVSVTAYSSYEGGIGGGIGYVYICKEPNSYVYHYSPHCWGLKKCSTALKKITEKEAKEKGRRLCGYED